jgi:hypothetical protein
LQKIVEDVKRLLEEAEPGIKVIEAQNLQQSPPTDSPLKDLQLPDKFDSTKLPTID